MASQPDATGFLTELAGGDQRAADKLLPLVYEELHALAEGYLRRERGDHTLQPTALIHEAYLKLVDQTKVDFNGKTHFKAVAARAMGRVLVDHARAHKRKKRGGEWRRVTLDDAFVLARPNQLDAMSLHDALAAMRKFDERLAQVVLLRVYGGLSNQETAQILGVAVRTVDRDWKMGQTWLRRELSRGATG